MKLILLASIFAFLAIASAQISVNAGGICPGCATNQDLLWIGTLNTQQIPINSRFRDARLRAAIDYINTDPLVANFDAMCIQELWDPARKQFFIDGVAQKFPNSFTTPSFERQDCDFNCSTGLGDFDNCFSDDCFNNLSDVFSDNAWDCLTDTCTDAFRDLDVDCQICVTSQDNAGLQGGIQNCRSATSNLINTAGTCLFLFGGNSDNILLSAYPLIETNFLLFSNSPFVASTVIHGKFQKGSSTVNLFCTHLIPANIEPANFESINRAQVQELIAFVNNNTAPGEFTVISGDFNTGPAVNGISGEWPNNFDLFAANGYESTFVTFGNPPSCSFCPEGGNFLASNFQFEGSQNNDVLIDHQFIRTGTACTAATGLFATENIVNVDSRNVPISDHFGVFSAYCLDTQPTIAPTVVPTFSPVVIAPSPTQPSAAGAVSVTPILTGVGLLVAIILYS